MRGWFWWIFIIANIVSRFVDTDNQSHVLNPLIAGKCLSHLHDVTSSGTNAKITRQKKLRNYWICLSRFQILFKFWKHCYDSKDWCNFIVPTTDNFYTAFSNFWNLLILEIQHGLKMNMVAVNWDADLRMLLKGALRHYNIEKNK